MPFDATDFVVTETLIPVRNPKTITDPRERLIYLRDFIAGLPPERFNLGYWFKRPQDSRFGWDVTAFAGETNATTAAHCGTVACIAGHALAIFAPDELVPESPGRRAAVILGLGLWEADALFEPYFAVGRSRTDVTNTQAARVLTHLINTGQIDWSVA